MIRLPVRQLKPGMVLAVPIYGPEGIVLLHGGVILRDSYIERLTELGVTGAYVRDGVADDVLPQSPISEQTRQFAVATVRQVFQELQGTGSLAHLDRVRHVVDEILDELLGQPGVVASLGDVRCADDFTFAHSVDVAVMSVICGIALGYARPRLVDLGTGALLHDIGKVRVQRALLTKPGPLTPSETESMKLHTVYGFEMLRGRHDVSAVAANVAYQHHERNDGSGYPRGLKEREIHPLAQVVAVADVFDAMTADRPYRRALPPHEAARFLTRTKGQLFNAMAVDSFLARVALYPTGNVVLLNTGELAVVIDQNRTDRARPVVRIFADRQGKRRRQPADVDLLNDPDRQIVGLSRWTPPPSASP